MTGLAAIAWRRGAVGLCLALIAAAQPGCSRKASGPQDATATAHLPAGCDSVARFDLKTLLESDAVKGHVAELKSGQGTAASKGRAALMEFLQAAHIEPTKDLREAAICLRQVAGDPEGARPVRQLIALSGQLHEHRLLEALAARAPAGQYEPVHLPGIEALRRKGGRLFAQAADGTILIGDDKDLLVDARDPGNRYVAYALGAGDVSLSANHAVLSSLAGNGPQHPFAALLGQADRVDIQMQARDSVLSATLQMPSPQQAVQSERRLTDFLAMLREGPGHDRLAQILPPGVLDAVGATKITRAENKTMLQTQLPKAALEELFHRVAVIGALGS